MLKLLLLTIKVIDSLCYHFPDQEIINYTAPVVNIRGVNQSVVVVMDKTIDDMLITSIIKELSTYQSIVLIEGKNHLLKHEKAVTNKDINIILITQTLVTEVDKSYANKTVKNFYWTPLYIIWADKTNNTCQNGHIEAKFFLNLQAYMNHIWHVFKTARILVTFPYHCPEHYILFHGKDFSNKTLYNRTIKMIQAKNTTQLQTALKKSGNPRYLTQGFPLRAHIFYRFMTSIVNCSIVQHYTGKDFKLQNKTFFCGLDGMVMHDFVQHYKFDLHISNDSSCSKYGFVEEDNSISGSLGCVVKEEIDISFNSRFLVHYNASNYYYLHYIMFDSLCAILKQPGTIPLWHYAFNLFPGSVYLLFLIIFLIIGIITWSSARLMEGITKIKAMELWKYILNTITTSVVGLPLIRDKQLLLFKTTSLICSIILLAMYQSNVNYQLTTKIRHQEFKTLRQLYRFSYDLYVSPSVLSILKSSIPQRELSRVHLPSCFETGYLLKHKNVATVARKADSLVEVQANYTDDFGNPLLYVIDECYYSLFLSYVAGPRFVFFEESHRFLTNLLEAGLPDRYSLWTRRTFVIVDKFPQFIPTPRPFTPFKLSNLRAAFGILIAGHLVSLIVFLVEKFKCRHSLYTL